MRLDPIEIHPYDLRWAQSFVDQSARLHAVLSPWLLAPVEHIGSTSIPGMSAKPIIDMLALVSDWKSFSSGIADLASIGWVHAPEPGDWDQRKWSICFPSVEHRTHHLHVVEHESPHWPDWLLLRNYLRTHETATERYADVKRRLAASDNTNRLSYRAGKAPLIGELMEEARAWQDLRGARG